MAEEASVKEDLIMEIEPPSFREGAVTAEDWRKALAKVVPAVVVLRTTAVRAFDTESAGASYATGFVVDKGRGIILTNRHVVQPGPVVAEAMFKNREEIPVYPMYRDPVHDFGFFCYDPSTIKFLSYEEVPLSPEAACVGLEIRVVGNDSGEKVLEHGEFVRVRTVHLNGKPRVLTLKQDLYYWPTWVIKFDPGTATWRRRIIKALD